MARVRKQYNCRKIADALSGRVWESAAEAAEELDCNKHVIYNSITRHHGVYTTQKGVDLILYYYQGHKLTPTEALDVNTPLTDLLNLLDSGGTNSKDVYYNNKDKMSGVEHATHALTNALSVLIRGEEIEDDLEE